MKASIYDCCPLLDLFGPATRQNYEIVHSIRLHLLGLSLIWSACLRCKYPKVRSTCLFTRFINSYSSEDSTSASSKPSRFVLYRISESPTFYNFKLTRARIDPRSSFGVHSPPLPPCLDHLLSWGVHSPKPMFQTNCKTNRTTSEPETNIR